MSASDGTVKLDDQYDICSVFVVTGLHLSTPGNKETKEGRTCITAVKTIIDEFRMPHCALRKPRTAATTHGNTNDDISDASVAS